MRIIKPDTKQKLLIPQLKNIRFCNTEVNNKCGGGGTPACFQLASLLAGGRRPITVVYRS